MPKTMKSLRLIACVAMLVFTALAVPTAASASTSQLSLIQDDRESVRPDRRGPHGRDDRDPQPRRGHPAHQRDLRQDLPDAHGPQEAGRLRDVRSQLAAVRLEQRPTGLVDLARANGIQVLMTVTSPGPFFSSTSPRALPPSTRARSSRRAASSAPSRPPWPSATRAGSTTTRSATSSTSARPGSRRASSAAAGSSTTSPPPSTARCGSPATESIARYDPARRNRVLFGETAADRIAAAVHPQRPVHRRQGQRAQGQAQPAPGLHRQGHQAQHRRASPSTPTTRAATARRGSARADQDGAPDRAHAAPAQADRARPPAAGGFRAARGSSSPSSATRRTRLTGSRTSPSPSRRSTSTSPTGSSTATAAIKTVAQYELTDVPELDQFNTGLRFVRASGSPPTTPTGCRSWSRGAAPTRSRSTARCARTAC